MTRRSAAGEALSAQVRPSHVPPADAGRVEQSSRRYCGLGCAWQEATRRVKRLRTVVCGARAQPNARPASAAAATSSVPLSPGARGEAPPPVGEGMPGLAAAREAGAGQAQGEGAPTPPGGPHTGTGRLGAEA